MKKTIISIIAASAFISGAAIAEVSTTAQPESQKTELTEKSSKADKAKKKGCKGNKAERAEKRAGKERISKEERKAKLFTKIDADGDGVITKAEWDEFEFKKKKSRAK